MEQWSGTSLCRGVRIDESLRLMPTPLIMLPPETDN